MLCYGVIELTLTCFDGRFNESVYWLSGSGDRIVFVLASSFSNLSLLSSPETESEIDDTDLSYA